MSKPGNSERMVKLAKDQYGGLDYGCNYPGIRGETHTTVTGAYYPVDGGYLENRPAGCPVC